VSENVEPFDPWMTPAAQAPGGRSPEDDGGGPLGSTLFGAAPLGGEPPLGGETPLGGEGAVSRRCGRCLAQFPGDPDAEPVVLQEFWLCPGCRETLLGKLSYAGVAVSPPTAVPVPRVVR